MSSTKQRERKKDTEDTFIYLYIHFFFVSFSNLQKSLSVYLLQLLGDAETGVDPLSAFGVFGLIVFQEIASSELSSYKPDQRQIWRQNIKKLHKDFTAFNLHSSFMTT